MTKRRFAQVYNERLDKCEQELKGNKIVVLNKFKEEYSQILLPFKQQHWTVSCIPEFFTTNPFPAIYQASCSRILFDRIMLRFLIPINITESLTFTVFPNLKELHLGNNYILTIQSIHKLNSPLLQSLCLDENLINNVKSLRKCHFPKLWKLDLRRNPIVTYDALSEMQLDSLSYLLLRFDEKQNLQKWWNKVYKEPLPSVIQHPNGDINFLFKNSSTCLFLYSGPTRSNTKKRRVLWRRQCQV